MTCCSNGHGVGKSGISESVMAEINTPPAQARSTVETWGTMEYKARMSRSGATVPSMLRSRQDVNMYMSELPCISSDNVGQLAESFGGSQQIEQPIRRRRCDTVQIVEQERVEAGEIIGIRNAPNAPVNKVSSRKSGNGVVRMASWARGRLRSGVRCGQTNPDVQWRRPHAICPALKRQIVPQRPHHTLPPEITALQVVNYFVPSVADSKDRAPLELGTSCRLVLSDGFDRPARNNPFTHMPVRGEQKDSSVTAARVITRMREESLDKERLCFPGPDTMNLAQGDCLGLLSELANSTPNGEVAYERRD
ncbi:hypothetical protein DFH09DRAFT_1088509 [Mycena vulgaris]|nr:hypothetical protein DFH09DRAFT_1088509 [Mycena vulgaris]